MYNQRPQKRFCDNVKHFGIASESWLQFVIAVQDFIWTKLAVEKRHRIYAYLFTSIQNSRAISKSFDRRLSASQTS
jgi:hypothetical protein